MKRFTAVMLLLMMSLCLTVSADASGTYFTIGTAQAVVGETISLPVTFTSDVPVKAFGIGPIEYDETVLEFLGFETIENAFATTPLLPQVDDDKKAIYYGWAAAQDFSADVHFCNIRFKVIGEGNCTVTGKPSVKGADNKDITGLTKPAVNLNATLKGFEGITFSSASYPYDGKMKQLAISGSLPNGATVTYTNEKGTTAGTYQATATVTCEGYSTLTLSATLTITPCELTITGATAADKTYDGTTTASVTDVTFDGVLDGESVSYTVHNAAFDTANAGANKAVHFTVTLLNETNYVLGTSTAETTRAINVKPVTVTLGSIADVIYTGDVITPAVTVTAEETINGEALMENRDYSVSYSNNLNSGTASVQVSSLEDSNYCFDTATTSFNIQRAELANIQVNPMVVSYTGLAIPTSSITGTATFNGATVSGTWSWVTEPAGVNASEEPYSAKVSFTPNNANLIGAECDLQVTICKATPSGEPSYTKLTETGKTLADAQLETGTITPAGGTILWVDEKGEALSLETEAAPFVSYHWLYIPADTDNYNTLGGTLVPCVYREAPATPTYRVTVADAENGSIQTYTRTADAGETVSFTVTANDGFVLDKVTVQTESGKALALTNGGNGRYSFRMPEEDVEICAVFVSASGDAPIIGGGDDTPIGGGDDPVIDDSSSRAFTDLASALDENPTAWWLEATNYVIDNGLMKGVGDNQFQPNGTTTRAMLVTILYRLDGSPAVSGACTFSDVPAGAWYTDAAIWASENGIVNGLGDGTFGADDVATREQIAVIFYRFAQHQGMDVSATTELDAYPDSGNVSVWALDAMKWANASGLMIGRADEQGNTVLAPDGQITRTEMAMLLYRWCTEFAK